ncbi:unnamed protein product, partial [marine sediment metagenome]
QVVVYLWLFLKHCVTGRPQNFECFNFRVYVGPGKGETEHPARGYFMALVLVFSYAGMLATVRWLFL